VGAIFSFFTQGVVLGFSAAASPGPFQAFLFASTARLGIRRAVPLTLAPLVSDVPIVALVLVALTHVPSGLLRAVEVAGGLFLLWLAWGSLHVAGEGSERRPAPSRPGGDFLRAVLVNAAGPGPWVFWSTVCGPILADAWRVSPARAVAFLAGFYGLLVGGKAVLVVAFGMAGRVGPGVARALAIASAAAMAVMGGLQLWRGLTGG
jgi:threonine/homoserine/homoserine lactone efflux protein